MDQGGCLNRLEKGKEFIVAAKVSNAANVRYVLDFQELNDSVSCHMSRQVIDAYKKTLHGREERTGTFKTVDYM